MKRRKTMDELYQEVKDFDLVLTHDKPLAEALNRRIHRPRLGLFAETIKNYVLKKTRYNIVEPIADDHEVVSDIKEKTGISYRAAKHYLSLIKDCWQKKG